MRIVKMNTQTRGKLIDSPLLLYGSRTQLVPGIERRCTGGTSDARVAASIIIKAKPALRIGPFAFLHSFGRSNLPSGAPGRLSLKLG